MEKKEKGIFIIIGIAVMYLLVSIAYNIAIKDVTLIENNSAGKNLIVFTFVPLNSILLLPFLASSYSNFKSGALRMDKFRNRIILLLIIAMIIFIFEIGYFKDIQTGIVNLINARTAQ